MHARRLAELVVVTVGVTCAVAAWADDKKPAPTADKKTDPPKKPVTPTREKAEQLKAASSFLEAADDARERGNKSFAEQMFSQAEIIVGPEALAELVPLYRDGAPPRVTTPLKKVEDTGSQPTTAGSSDKDEPDAKPARGSLTGKVLVDGKPLADGLGVVTLEPANHKFKKRTPKQRTMEQRNRTFSPHVLVVPVGSTITFPNFDGTYHNVFSLSDSKAFDLGLYKNGDAREVTFDKEGIVRLGCNLHANMSAWVVVVSEPHYVTTEPDGSFTFGSLEPGKYTLKAWSEKSAAPITQDIEIKAGKNTVEVGVKGDAPAGPPADKFGFSRGGAGKK